MSAYVDVDTWLDTALAFTREHLGQPIVDDAEDRNRKAAILWLAWKSEYPTWRVEVSRGNPPPDRLHRWGELAFFVVLGAGVVVALARLIP